MYAKCVLVLILMVIPLDAEETRFPVVDPDKIFGQSSALPAKNLSGLFHQAEEIPDVTHNVKNETLPSVLGHVCVPIGTCNPIPNIVDVNQPLCPSGMTPCYGTAGGQQCGLRFVTPIYTSDGTATRGAHPWQVYLVNETGYVGSGALIDEYTIVTAAHKVYMYSASPESMGVHLGVYNTSDLGKRYTVDRIHLNPNFDPSNLFNDMALVRLLEPVVPITQMYVNKICLPSEGQSFVGQTCTVSGWGKTAFGDVGNPTRILKEVDVPVVSTPTCYNSMRNESVLGADADKYLDKVGELCAGGQEGKDACTEDGGAPLVCKVNEKFVLAGLVIWGKGCGQVGVYGVYANISHYVAWIRKSATLLTG